MVEVTAKHLIGIRLGNAAVDTVEVEREEEGRQGGVEGGGGGGGGN